jgi:hypothetical protein
MDMDAFSFDQNFEPGAISGQMRLGKFQSHYEEIFAEVIEDGVITAEERARLNRAADALGLDRAQLQRLEQALEAAYETRHHVRVREVGDEEPAPVSLVLSPQGAGDPRVAELELRIAKLEARIQRLTDELEAARAQITVEVDVSAIDTTAAATSEDSTVEAMRQLRRDPRDVPALRALYRIYATAQPDADRQWLCAQALAFVGGADDDHRRTFARGRTDGLIRPTASLSDEGWKLLFHPDEEILTGQIFAVIVGPVLLGRVSTLRRERTLPRLDPACKQDPKASTLQAVRCFSWAGAVLGMAVPPLYADPDFAGAVEMVPGVPPPTRLGARVLSGRSPAELAFIAGRHLSWHREEHFVRLLVPSIADLENLFLAALSIANAGIPLNADVKRRVGPLARAIEPLLEPAAIDRLRGHFLRFIEEGGRTNLQRWAVAAGRTASRAGLLLANDLQVAEAVLGDEDPGAARETLDDLLTFMLSERYPQIRRQMGIAVRD